MTTVSAMRCVVPRTDGPSDAAPTSRHRGRGAEPSPSPGRPPPRVPVSPESRGGAPGDEGETPSSVPPASYWRRGRGRRRRSRGGAPRREGPGSNEADPRRARPAPPQSDGVRGRAGAPGSPPARDGDPSPGGGVGPPDVPRKDEDATPRPGGRGQPCGVSRAREGRRTSSAGAARTGAVPTSARTWAPTSWTRAVVLACAGGAARRAAGRPPSFGAVEAPGGGRVSVRGIPPRSPRPEPRGRRGTLRDEGRVHATRVESRRTSGEDRGRRRGAPARAPDRRGGGGAAGRDDVRRTSAPPRAGPGGGRRPPSTPRGTPRSLPASPRRTGSVVPLPGTRRAPVVPRRPGGEESEGGETRRPAVPAALVGSSAPRECSRWSLRGDSQLSNRARRGPSNGRRIVPREGRAGARASGTKDGRGESCGRARIISRSRAATGPRSPMAVTL